MDLIFANPAGWWALLGIPAIIAIHFFQEEARPIRVSTLFLLEKIAPRSTEGRKWDRLRQSVPLYLQLLAVMIAAWILAEPRWIHTDSSQHVALVLDSSVSMRAFQSRLRSILEPRLKEIAAGSGKTEWLLMESDLTKPTLYRGADLEAMFAALDKWKPTLGDHDPAPALRLASTLPGTAQPLLVYVSDRKTELPAGVELMAVGEPVENTGFAGQRVIHPDSAEPAWEALVKNYGDKSATRTWWMEQKGGKSTPQELTLGPGQTRALKGTFPAGVDRVSLVLSPDAFTMDDRLPLERPKMKPLRVAVVAEGGMTSFFQKLVDSFLASQLVPLGDQPDIVFASRNPTSDQAINSPAIVALDDPSTGTELVSGTLLAERVPWNEDLNWSGLLARDGLKWTPKPEDQVLLWQGKRALIFVRNASTGSRLYLNFDIVRSGATQMPSLIILLHRFVEATRGAKLELVRQNFDVHQSFPLMASANGPALERKDETEPPASTAFPAAAEANLRAPSEPGFFAVKQGEKTLLEGAAGFADAREADFRKAEFIDGLKGQSAVLSLRRSEADPYQPLWIALLGLLMLGNWAWLARRGSGTAP